MLKHILTINCAIALLFVAASPGTAHAERSPEKLYLLNCKLCHGAKGTPSAPFAKRGVKDLSDARWQDSKTDEQVRSVIIEGVEDTLMKAFEQDLTPGEVDAIVSHVRGLRRK